MERFVTSTSYAYMYRFPRHCFWGYYGQLEDRAVNIAEVHSKIVFESKIKEDLVVQGLSL
ncbi:hypothetical protein GFV16_21160 [Bacillus megaterium]|nr:hypothetical protein [Priestia megaterium]